MFLVGSFELTIVFIGRMPRRDVHVMVVFSVFV